jgi:hypothetical protein
MNRFVISFLILITTSSLSAQFRWDAGIKAGASNYLGDLGGKAQSRRNFVSDMKLAETKMSFGAFARYKLKNEISINTSYNYGRIAGDDKLSANPGRHNRNLNFRNDIHELAVQGEYYFYSIEDLGHSYTFQNSFRAYAGFGVAAFHHNPKAFYKGEWVPLAPLRTEGEAKPYSNFGIAIPMTLGIYFTINKYYRLGWDICWRKTFTDYLDDVSTTYAAPSVLPNALSIALANRSGELSLPYAVAANYVPQSKRGDPTHKDTYIFTTFNFSYVFRGRWFKRSGLASHGRITTRRKKSIRVKF